LFGGDAGSLGGGLGGQGSLAGELAFMFQPCCLALRSALGARGDDGFTLPSFLDQGGIFGIKGPLEFLQQGAFGFGGPAQAVLQVLFVTAAHGKRLSLQLVALRRTSYVSQFGPTSRRR